jgi:hypothetical protein
MNGEFLKGRLKNRPVINPQAESFGADRPIFIGADQPHRNLSVRRELVGV